MANNILTKEEYRERVVKPLTKALNDDLKELPEGESIRVGMYVFTNNSGSMGMKVIDTPVH